jgi:predicted dienelactone hydrolase
MFKFSSSIDRRLTVLGFVTAFTLGGAITVAVNAAERIFFVYSPLIASLKVESLEKFAKDGRINDDLGFYLGLAKVSEEQKSSFREALTQPIDIDPVLLSRSLNTDSAERLLNYFGSVVNIKGGRNGKYLLRGALVQAAFEKEGLTLINVLKKLAVDIEVDIEQILTYSQQVDLLIRGTELFIKEIAYLANQEAQSSPKIDFSQKLDIRSLGELEVTNSTLQLYDSQRKRKFYVELYRPQELKPNTHVIVFSHGLSSSPEDFAKRAIHLASYGYVVAMPQHPGSDILKTKDFINGYTREIFDKNEFINRPLDISFLLDELTRLNESQFQGKLNLENVGVAGHSFGGYTALAIGGAEFDFETLKRNCDSSIGNLNTALLAQCRALLLEQNKTYNLRDSRVKAVYASNPFNSAIFGQNGLSKLEIPVFISAGSYDPATPFAFEQGRTFHSIGSSQAYLQLQEGQAHVDFSQLDAGISDLIERIGNLTLPAPDLLDSYTNSMTLAFFKVYLNNENNYQIYLQSQYGQYLSEGQEFKNYLITKASALEIKNKYEQFVEENQDLIIDK